MERGSRLGRRGVDAEGHALSTVGLLLAIEPSWVQGHDLHLENRWGVHGIVNVGHEARIYCTGHLHAGKSEGRLRKSVVLGHEGEGNHVTDCGIDGAWREDQAIATANNDLVVHSR